MNKKRTYIAIDLKSFYASVECVERGLNPLTTNLVVADRSRTDKTICLAVSPSLKAWGVSGRPRLFEVIQRVKELNDSRLYLSDNKVFNGVSCYQEELEANPHLGIAYITAVPHMALYLAYGNRIHSIYRKYVSSKDIHIYSVDEVFIDATDYLKTYCVSARDLTKAIIQDVFKQTGITATGGIGTNLYLCKVAMDIVAKHIEGDKDGVRIAELDEYSYREELWRHTPLTDFWRIGHGIANRLCSYGIDTMGKLARFSLSNSEILYKIFGVNAELLIDHAWGWESCTMEDIKEYRSTSTSMSNGQVLSEPYSFGETRLVLQEMAEALSLDLTRQQCVTKQVELYIGYDTSNIDRVKDGRITIDFYGRRIPMHAHGRESFHDFTSSTIDITRALLAIFDKVVNKDFLIRRINIGAVHVIKNTCYRSLYQQVIELDLFHNNKKELEYRRLKLRNRKREQSLQETTLKIKQRFGRNSALRGLNYRKGATARERNLQIGGHKV